MAGTNKNKLTPEQQNRRFGLILITGMLAQYSIDKFGPIILTEGQTMLLTLFTITVMTILSSRFISKKMAIRTAVIASVFESAYGQILLIKSSNSPAPWPPAYILSILIYAGLFYLYALLINIFVRQKFSP